MTGTNPNKITPEEWRTAAKVARRSIFGNSELADAWENVAKYSSAADLTTQLAKAIRAAWVDRLDWDELAHAALKFLTATGRLVPAGGIALAVEQVEDVRTLVGHGGSDYAEAFNRLRALFPATEPAECEFRCDEGIVRAGVGVRCPACTGAIRDKEAIEPAEEETKAEGSCVMQSPQGDFCSFPKPDHAGVHTWAWPDKEPTSSPVVLAPTETGPWDSIEEVPEGVTVRGTNPVAGLWRGGPYWKSVSPEHSAAVSSLAPFVVAEEG